MKLLSRVILLVNGAIDAMYNDTMKNNEGAGDLLPMGKKGTRTQCMVFFWAPNEAKKLAR